MSEKVEDFELKKRLRIKLEKKTNKKLKSKLQNKKGNKSTKKSTNSSSRKTVHQQNLAFDGIPRKTAIKDGEIDWKMVAQLMTLHCTQEEIADYISVPLSVLQSYEVFNTLWNKYNTVAKVNLRKYQWEAAKNGNTGILIWLGKQYLNQSETPDTGNKGVPVKIVVNRSRVKEVGEK